MYEFIIDGYKRGYLRNYAMAPTPKNESHDQQESDLIGQMMHILMRYTKSNIILGEDNPSGRCHILGKLLNKIYRKTGIKELDNLKICIFDPAKYSENFRFDGLANRHFKCLLNELAGKGNALLSNGPISGGKASMNRNGKIECRTTIRIIFNIQSSAMRLNNGAANTQPHT